MSLNLFNRKCKSTTKEIKQIPPPKGIGYRKDTNTKSPGLPGSDNIKDYKVFTKDDYVRYRLTGERAEYITDKYIDSIYESWDKLSKGYKFVIVVGQEDSLMFYSVDYFNENILRR